MLASRPTASRNHRPELCAASAETRSSLRVPAVQPRPPRLGYSSGAGAGLSSVGDREMRPRAPGPGCPLTGSPAQLWVS